MLLEPQQMFIAAVVDPTEMTTTALFVETIITPHSVVRKVQETAARDTGAVGGWLVYEELMVLGG